MADICLNVKYKLKSRCIQSMESIIDDNRYQSISIKRLILIIDDQSMAKIRVVIDWYRLIHVDGTGINTQKTQFFKQ